MEGTFRAEPGGPGTAAVSVQKRGVRVRLDALLHSALRAARAAAAARVFVLDTWTQTWRAVLPAPHAQAPAHAHAAFSAAHGAGAGFGLPPPRTSTSLSLLQTDPLLHARTPAALGGLGGCPGAARAESRGEAEGEDDGTTATTTTEHFHHILFGGYGQGQGQGEGGAEAEGGGEGEAADDGAGRQVPFNDVLVLLTTATTTTAPPASSPSSPPLPSSTRLGFQWLRPRVGGLPPSPRLAHAACTLPLRMREGGPAVVVFGGYAGRDQNDVYMLALDADADVDAEPRAFRRARRGADGDGDRNSGADWAPHLGRRTFNPFLRRPPSSREPSLRASVIQHLPRAAVAHASRHCRFPGCHSS